MVKIWSASGSQIVTKSVILSTLRLGILVQMFCGALCPFHHGRNRMAHGLQHPCTCQVTSGKLAIFFLFFLGLLMAIAFHRCCPNIVCKIHVGHVGLAPYSSGPNGPMPFYLNDREG